MDAKLVVCDFAEVSGGKMFISGAGLFMVNSATPNSPYRVNMTLAILGLIRQEDTERTHKMTIELVQVGDSRETRVALADDLPPGSDPADRGMFIVYFRAPHQPQMLASDEWSMPMAIPMFGLGLPVLGPYYFSVRVDGREMDRSSFRLLPPAPPQQVPAEIDQLLSEQGAGSPAQTGGAEPPL
ncbi:MAG TPA: hypothetical protein VME46_02850 [Acidimicrobiales bacterium]|nr:hypothetical protein [Acidimicrobiales bacterium]